MSLLTGLFSKLSVVGGFFSAYRFIVIGVLAATIFGAITFYVYTAERAKGEVETLQVELDSVKRDFGAMQLAINLNEAALATCIEANVYNLAELHEQQKLIAESLTTIKLLQAESAHTVEDIRDDADKLRGRDTECRTVDQPYPGWFIVGLWE